MEIYSDFARVYDMFIDAPYDEWVDYLEEIWRKCGLSPEVICDLGCGTGSLTARLAGRGYSTIGVDISADMLAIAQQKDNKTLFLQQDMRNFELYGTVDVITCLCDSLNYILDVDEVRRVFALAANYLNPGGLFVFDVNTPHKYANVLADNTFARTEDAGAYIWENFYDDETGLNEYALTIFEQRGDTYERIEEVHTQKAHGDEELRQALELAGLELVGVYDELGFDAPKADSSKVFYVARKV